MTEGEANADRRRHADWRLDNIEQSIRRMEATLAELSRAMISLARVEERLASSQEKSERLEKDIAGLRVYISDMGCVNARQDADSAADRARSLLIERVVWAVVLGAVTAYFGFGQGL